MYRIACPQCSKILKFRDASRVGSKAKCPKCGHRFVVELPKAPDEVELQLAEPPRSTPPAPGKQPLVGTSAKWVPDEPNQAQPTQQAQPTPVSPPIPSLPATPNQPTAPAAPPANQFDFVEPAGPIVVAAEETSTVHNMQQRKKRRGKGGMLLAIGGFLATAGVAGAVFFWNQGNPPAEDTRQQVVANENWQAEKEELESAAQAAQDLSPTSGEPVELKGLLPGANIVLHLHPAEVWSDNDSRREFVFALGPLATWLETKIRELSGYEPSEIDQLTIAIGLGPRESEPEVSALVQLKQEQPRSTLIQKLNGKRDPEFLNADILVGDSNAWLIVDTKTFSVGPKELAAELAASADYAADPSDDLRTLMARTDRNRHVTVLFDTSQLAIHTPTLVDAALQPALVRLTDWLGKDVDAVAASLHLGDKMFLETLVRNGTGTTPARLNRHMRSRLDELPNDVLKMVRYMRPSRKGPRQIIARFPAMANAFSAATMTGIDSRLVQLTTILPERALPNLAVGTILTWDESTRTNFDRDRTPQTSTPSTKLPKTLAERLKLKVEIEFNRTPMEDAFAMLGEDIGVNFVLDGDGLELASYTRNQTQTFNLGTAPVVDGVKSILKNYEKMVLVADEANKTITVTTRAAAEANGQKIYELP